MEDLEKKRKTFLFSKKILYIRSLTLLFWVGIIALALYFPHWNVFHSEKRSLNIFAWGDILDPEVITTFEQETGVQIRLNYYSSNEELLVKLKATGGEGYDLIIPSDYAVPLLVKEGLLKPINHSKLDFWTKLNPLLIGQKFDPDNRYSIPFEWELFGLGINRYSFQEQSFDPSLSLIFEKPDYKVAMVNDPMQALLFADLYLHGKISQLNEEEFREIKKLLIAQRKWVIAYADFRADYFLATGNCSVAVASTSYIWRTKRLFPFVDFVIPKEGTFITIENLCIPSSSQKEASTYAFINYLFRPASAKRHFETFGLFPATLKEENEFELDRDTYQLLRLAREQFSKYHFFQRIAPQEQVWDLWVEVKS